MNAPSGLNSCPACGNDQFAPSKVLWEALIREWQLAPHEAAYVDRQQGYRCNQCNCNLRAMGLAAAISRAYGFAGPLIKFFDTSAARSLKMLEINGAGELTKILARLPGRTIAEYPTVDMRQMPYADRTFDLIVHSDTLEHVPNPIRGLADCRRVLKPGGYCAFTIPVIVDRLTRDRAGLPPSYHGNPAERGGDWMVQTEYGADAWKQVIQAGFVECRLSSLEYPSTIAFVGVRGSN